MLPRTESRCLRAHVILLLIKGSCSCCQKRPPAPGGGREHQVRPVNRPLWRLPSPTVPGAVSLQGFWGRGWRSLRSGASGVGWEGFPVCPGFPECPFLPFSAASVVQEEKRAPWGRELFLQAELSPAQPTTICLSSVPHQHRSLRSGANGCNRVTERPQEKLLVQQSTGNERAR